MLSVFQPGSPFLPHGYCIQWQPGLLWTLAGSDLVIALSYFTIPVALAFYARKQPALRYRSIVALFAVFILACGVTHVIEVVNLWRPAYHISAGAKFFTAVVSALTAIVIWPTLREMSAFIDGRRLLQEQLAATNAELETALQKAESRKRALQQSERAFRATLIGAPIGMAVMTPDGSFTMVNKALCEMLGYSARELAKTNFQDLTHPEDLDADVLHVSSLLEGLADSYRMEKRYRHRDGHVVYAQLDVSLIRDPDGKPQHLVKQIQDITARKQMENALLESRHRWRSLLDNLPSAVVVHRADTAIEYVNPASAQLLGLSEAQMLGKTATDPHWRFIRDDGSDMPMDEYPVMLVATNKSPLRDYVIGVISGREQPARWLMVNAFPLINTEGELDRIIVSFVDISDRKCLEQELSRQASTDSLTGLFNRRHFVDAANHELVRARRKGTDMALMAVDLDHFKSINDNHGHAVGDRALARFGDLCRGLIRDSDVACRLGGEEFAVLMPETSLEQAMQVAERLREMVSEAPLIVPGQEPLYWTASIGVACLARPEESVDQLLSRADAALYRAKQAGRDQVLSA